MIYNLVGPRGQNFGLGLVKLVSVSTFWYDTIRYHTVDLRALKSWRDGHLNLALIKYLNQQ